MMCCSVWVLIFFFNQKTAYEMRISDWSSDVCSSDLQAGRCGDTGRLKLNVSEFGSKGGDIQPPIPAARTPLQLCAGFIIGHLLRSKALKWRKNRGKPRCVQCARAVASSCRYLEESVVEIGRAWCGERVCKYVLISVG